MLPVAVACLNNVKTLISIEQPELHIHPAVQVGLGDLFIHCINQNLDLPNFAPSLLVETHSEHLMLRLLRRIEETTEGELPPGQLGLTKQQISVIFVDAETKEFKNISVSDNGDFTDEWPGGFFRERSKELFH